MALTKSEKERFARQIVLDEVGANGQQKLLNARVLIVGMGGLGAPVASYLAAAGVGVLGLVDGDLVEVSNLQRQVIFAESQVGQAKVQAARVRLLAQNKHCKINMHKLFINAENAETLIASYDLVVDCSDNFAARYAINDACLAQGKAFVFGSLYRFEGQVSVFCAGEDKPCYRCFNSRSAPYAVACESAETDIPNCAEAGILGSLAGVIGSLQATEALKALLGAGADSAGHILMYDGLAMRFDNFALVKSSGCICHSFAGTERHVAGAQDLDSFAGEASETPPERLPTTITPAELATALDDNREAFSLIDCRETKEWRAMRLSGSQHIPLGEIVDRADEIESDRPVIVICRSGSRSKKACAMLRDMGFIDVRNLTGGLMAWYREFEEKNIESDASF
jgi:molybdopterin/thiamine biosynthesis adenylyltransferase/rhodanese-related sulfurtransferase